MVVSFPVRRVGSSSHRIGVSSSDTSQSSCSQLTVSVNCSQGSSTAEFESLEPFNSSEEMMSGGGPDGSCSSAAGTGTTHSQDEELASSDSLVQFCTAERKSNSASPASEKKVLSHDWPATPRSVLNVEDSTRGVSRGGSLTQGAVRTLYAATTRRSNLCPSKQDGKKAGPVGTCSLDRFRYASNVNTAESVAVQEPFLRDCADRLTDSASPDSGKCEILREWGRGEKDSLCRVESQLTPQSEVVEVDEHSKGYRQTQPFRFSSQSLVQRLRDLQCSMSGECSPTK